MVAPLDAALAGWVAPGLWRLDTLPPDYAQHIADWGFRPAVVRCPSPCTKEKLLDALARALDFPDYFGHNWDAVADCLSDLSWVSEPGIIIVFEDADPLFSEQPAMAMVLSDVLIEAAEYWYHRNVPFYAIAQTSDEQLPALTATAL